MIEVAHLTKVFDSKTAVDDISFQVQMGEIMGFLGPNGAGKSTTMRMITGFLPPTAGTAVIGGADILQDSLAARRKIGYLPENAPVYPDMRVVDFLEFCATIRGFTGRDRRTRIEETIDRCFLADVRFQTVGTLSKGFKQRVCFAQSILHDPEYLIFDEPTDGLDPNQKHEVRLMIRRMAAEKAIILSTHILDEVEAVCTRAIIIAEGKIVADDTPEALKAMSPAHGAVLVDARTGAPEALLSALDAATGVRSTEIVSTEGDTARLRIYPETDGPPIVDKVATVLTEQAVSIQSMVIEQGRLDEVFRDITTR